jgi:hypothetical protein
MTTRLLAFLALAALLLGGCGAQTAAPEQSPAITPETEVENMLQLKIGDTLVPVTWEDNESVRALRALAEDEGLTISMSMYGGFEQVGAIGQSIVRDDVQTTTEAGDIMLYAGDQIVLFYGSNRWAYTRLGRMELSQQQLKELLGNGDVTITIFTEE